MARWFRHYVGMMRDGKIVGIAVRTRQTVERVGFIWACILEDAAERNDGGAYQLDRDGIAFFLRADPDEVSLILSEMEGAGLVAKGKVCKWAARQHESDSSAARTRRYRQKRRSGDGDVTSPDRHFVTCDGLEAEADTEEDTEIEKELAAASLSIGSQSDDPRSLALADEQLLGRLLTAIGRSGTVPPAMRDLGPIRALLADGYDLDRDMIALLTAKRATGKVKAAQSWAYFIEAIREHRAKAAPVMIDLHSLVWVGVEDPLWQAVAGRYAAEHGKPPPTDRLNGWRFPRLWLSTEAPPAEPPGRRHTALGVHTEALGTGIQRRHRSAAGLPIDADLSGAIVRGRRANP